MAMRETGIEWISLGSFDFQLIGVCVGQPSFMFSFLFIFQVRCVAEAQIPTSHQPKEFIVGDQSLPDWILREIFQDLAINLRDSDIMEVFFVSFIELFETNFIFFVQEKFSCEQKVRQDVALVHEAVGLEIHISEMTSNYARFGVDT